MASQPALAALSPAFTRFEVLQVLRRGRLPAAWRSLLDRDPLLQRVAMVIEVSLGGMSGRTVRVATVPIRSASSRRGTRHDAVPGLIEEPSISADYTISVGSSPARQIDFTVDASLIEPLKAIRSGMFLSGVAEIALEPTDRESDYDERYVLLRGDIQDVSFGAPSDAYGRREIVTMSITDPRESCSTRFPPWTLDTERQASVHDSAVGGTYPIVLNSAYRLPAPRLTSAALGSNRFAVAAGEVDVTAAAGNVFLNGVSAFGGTTAWVAESETDALGTTYTVIRFTNAALVWDDSDAVHVTCSERAAEARLNPVDAIRRLVEGYSPIGPAGVDHALFASASAAWPGGLDAPRVMANASGGSSANILDWIENGFLASFPMISMVWSTGGYGPVLTDSRSPPIAHFVVGQNPIVDRASLLTETSKAELLNQFSLRYGYDPMRDTWAGVVTRSPSNSSVCETSRMLVGQRDAQPIDSVYITDRSTADYVLDWLVQHRALPSYIVEYNATPAAFLLYQRGDTVALTDDELGFQAERATIEKLVYQRGNCKITFRVWLRLLDVGAGALSRPATL